MGNASIRVAQVLDKAGVDGWRYPGAANVRRDLRGIPIGREDLLKCRDVLLKSGSPRGVQLPANQARKVEVGGFPTVLLGVEKGARLFAFGECRRCFRFICTK